MSSALTIRSNLTRTNPADVNVSRVYREAWLDNVARLLRPHFARVGAPLPLNVRMSIGFPSTGLRGKRLGECWDKSASGSGTAEIFIRPDYFSDDVADLEIAAVLVHELIHAALGSKAAHGPAFRKIALRFGLAGKMTATVPGPMFRRLFDEGISPIVGPLPHAKLNVGDRQTKTSGGKNYQKVYCEACGYTARVAQKWLDEVGAPHCPDHGAMICAG
jgi:SprT-like family